MKKLKFKAVLELDAVSKALALGVKLKEHLPQKISTIKIFKNQK